MMMAEDRTHEGREEEAGKPAPRRQCAGCAKRDDADALLRVVLGPAGELAVDFANSRFGRGAHVHASAPCVEKALRGGIARSFGRAMGGNVKIDASPAALAAFAAQVVVGAERRIEGLLLGARRGKLVVAGADVVTAALEDGSARLVVVASDAAAATKLRLVDEAIADGRAVVWGNKQRLGALFGRDETAVCAVLHEGVADAIGRATQMALPFASRSEAWTSSEVR